MGRELSLSYFDHPPLSFWLAGTFESFLGKWNELGVRLPNILLGLGTLAGFGCFFDSLFGPRSARIGLILIGFSPAVTITGIETLPDSTLLFGFSWCLTAFTCAVLAIERNAKSVSSWVWIIGGLGLGIAFASKYQIALLVLPMVVWFIFTPKAWTWLKNIGFWFAISMAILSCLPTLVWNFNNDWASFRFQSGRAEGQFAPSSFLSLLAAQAIYLGPLLFTLTIYQITKSYLWTEFALRPIAIIGTSGILVMNTIFLFSPSSLPHWSIPSWLVLCVFSAHALTNLSTNRALILAVTFGALQQALLLALALHMRYGILNLSCTDMQWDRTSPHISVNTLRKSLDERSSILDNQVIYSPTWIEAGIIGLALGTDRFVHVLNADQRHFQFARTQEISPGVVISLDENQVDLPSDWVKQNFSLFELDRFLINRGQCPYFSVTLSQISK